MNVPPVAALGVMVYGPAAAVAAVPAGVPLAVKVTDPTVSAFCKPLVVNALVPSANVAPYVLLRALAVIVRAAGLTVSVPVA